MAKMNASEDSSETRRGAGVTYVGLHQSFARIPSPRWNFGLAPKVVSAVAPSPAGLPRPDQEKPLAPTRKPSQAPLPIIKAGTRAAKRRKRGEKKQASRLNQQALIKAHAYIREHSRSPQSDILKLRLSRFGGLRAGEIAALPISALLEPDGSITDEYQVHTLKSRNSSGVRKIPMHQEIADAVVDLRAAFPHANFVAFTVGNGGVLRRQSASSLANWFHRLYSAIGLNGCSSHSGRRTFATEVARNLGQHNTSLRDLQRLLGHKSLASTECYVDLAPSVHSLVRSLGHVG